MAPQVLPVPLPRPPWRSGKRFGIAAGNQPFRQRRPQGRLAAVYKLIDAMQAAPFRQRRPRGRLAGRMSGSRAQVSSAFRNPPGRRSFSDSVSGCSCTISIRPASDSVTAGVRSRLAEPVSRKRPGRRSRSTACLIDGKESRRTLNLVHGRSLRQAGHETRRILGGGPVVARLVEAYDRTPGRQLPRQRGLAALPRTEKAYDGRIRQGFPNGGRQRARKQQPGRVHLLVSGAADCRLCKRLITGCASG